MTALSMFASGTSYELAAKSVNMTAKQIRKWNKHKDTKDFLDADFNEIDARLTAGWYVHSGQRKRYLKSLNQKKK